MTRYASRNSLGGCKSASESGDAHGQRHPRLHLTRRTCSFFWGGLPSFLDEKGNNNGEKGSKKKHKEQGKRGDKERHKADTVTNKRQEGRIGEHNDQHTTLGVNEGGFRGQWMKHKGK